MRYFILKLVLVNSIVIAKVVSLAPFRYDFKQKIFIKSKIYEIYTLLIFLLCFISYPIAFANILNSRTKADIEEFAEKFDFVLDYFLMVLTLSIQFANRHLIIKMCNQFLNIFNYMKSSLRILKLNYNRWLFFYIFKVYIFGGIFVIFEFLNTINFLSIYPTILILFLSHLYFGGMLIVSFLLNILNSELRKCFNNLQVTKSFGKQLQICDRLDELYLFHSKICDLTKNLNKINSAPILLIICHGFVVFLIQLYFFFLLISKSVLNSKEFIWYSAVLGLFNTMIGFIDIYFIIDICSTTQNAVKELLIEF